MHAITTQTEIDEFCEEVYSVADTYTHRYAIGFIFQTMNDMLMEGHFDAVAAILQNITPSKLSPMLLTSFLTITAAAREKLGPHRGEFYDRAYKAIQTTKGKEATDKLLIGLN